MTKALIQPVLRLFSRILRRLGLRRPSRPEDIPRKLSPDALQRALAEARFLRGAHAVDVRSLTPGELPVPRRADGGD